MINIDLAAAKSEALFNISKFLKENIKSSDTKDKVKIRRTEKTTTIDLISKKKVKVCTCSKLFFLISKRAAHLFVHFLAVVLHD